MSSRIVFERKENYASQKALTLADPQTEEYTKTLFYASIVLLKKWT
jgi:hypothetical protein